MKPAAQIKYFSGGDWHDLPRAEAARMMRESRANYDCDRLFPHEYILHQEEFFGAHYIRTAPLTP